VSTQQTRHSVRRRRRSEGFRCGLRPVAAVSGAEAAAAADGVGCVAAAISDCTGMQQVALRCNGLRCAATDTAACNCRWSDAAGGALLQAALRCNQFRFCPVGEHSRRALGRCNRLRCDATGNAKIQRDEQRCGGRGTPVCARARSSSCLNRSVASSSVTLPKA
jgi:hypothetical protein